MGTKKQKSPLEGKRKSMKELTKGYEELMKKRNADRKVENEDGVEKFEDLLQKAVKKPRKA